VKGEHGLDICIDKYPRIILHMNTVREPCAYIRYKCVNSYSYSKVDAVLIELKYMVNIGARGEKKDRNRKSGWIGILL
jgi:hypothetical protein